MLKILPKFSFGKYKFNGVIINKVSALLKIKPSLVNEDINYFGDVRLLDSQNKLLGVFACEEVRKKAAKLGQDVVMINQDVKPALCKVCNFSDELAQKFMNDIVKIKEQGKMSDQVMKLGHTISMQDLKLKINQAKEILKKQNTLRVIMVCPLDSAIQSKSILYTLRDLSQGFMAAKDDIKMKEYKEKDVPFEKRKDQVEQVQLDYEFEAVEFKEAPLDLPQIKIERLINQFYSKSLQEKTEDEQDIADLFKGKEQDKTTKPKEETKKSSLEQMMEDDEFDEEFLHPPVNSSSFYVKNNTFAKYVKLFKLIEWSESKK